MKKIQKKIQIHAHCTVIMFQIKNDINGAQEGYINRIGPEALLAEIIYIEKVASLLEAFDFQGWIIKTQLL